MASSAFRPGLTEADGPSIDVRIPKIIHQLWKDETIPPRWELAAASVRRFHKGWTYRLWTDELMMQYVRSNHADFYPVFAGMQRHIMRVDIFRYVLMHDFGGMYCDLDYEFVRPYDYGDAAVVLSLEYDEAFGDDENQIANYVFASEPGHPFWADILHDVRHNPPQAPVESDVCVSTGPKLVTRIYYSNQDKYQGIRLTSQPVLSPRRVHGRYERKFYINSGITFGFHYGWGSWRDRLTLSHIRRKLAKRLGFGRARKRTPATQPDNPG